MNLDKLVQFSYHGDHYVYCTSQQDGESRILQVNELGFDLYVKDPAPSIDIKLLPNSPSDAALQLEEKIRVVDNQDVKITASPIAGNSKQDGYENGTYFDTLGSIKGHIWNASASAGGKQIKLEWTVGEPRQVKPAYISESEEIVDVKCVARVCAFMLRSHMRLAKSKLVFVEDLDKVINKTDLLFGEYTNDYYLVEAFVDQATPTVASWLVKEESSSTVNAAGGYWEYRLNLSSSELTKTKKGTWLLDHLSVHGLIKDFIILTSFNRSSGDLSPYSQHQTALYPQEIIKNVKAYAAVLAGSKLFIIYSMMGLNSLHLREYRFSEFNDYGLETSRVSVIPVFFERMDEFDQIQCEIRGDISKGIECIFAGRTMAKALIDVEAVGNVTVRLLEDEDQKVGYKNWMCDNILKIQDIVMVEGRRLQIQPMPASTFDWSGVLVYSFRANASKWMVAGLSKDHLFDLIGANKYKM